MATETRDYILILVIVVLGIAVSSEGKNAVFGQTKSRYISSLTPEFTGNSSQNHKDIKQKILKCKEAVGGDDRLICNSLNGYRDDQVSFDAFEVTYRKIDFNGDGINEIIAWESSWAGTSGGGLWILARKGKKYRKIFETDTTWAPIILLPSKSHSWRDFAYYVTGGGVEPVFVTVSHNGRSYHDRARVSTQQPKGEILIGKNWRRSTFGPISDN
jgi:hypothetical protein